MDASLEVQREVFQALIRDHDVPVYDGSRSPCIRGVVRSVWDTLELLTVTDAEFVAVPEKRVVLGVAGKVGVAVKLIPLDTKAAAVDACILQLGSALCQTRKSVHFPFMFCAVVVMDRGQLCAALVMERFDMTLRDFFAACIRDADWAGMYDAVMQAMMALAQGQEELGLVHNDMSLGNFMVTRSPTTIFAKTPSGAVLHVQSTIRVALLDFGRATIRLEGECRFGTRFGTRTGPGTRTTRSGPGPTQESLSKDVFSFARTLRDFLPSEWTSSVGEVPGPILPLVQLLNDEHDQHAAPEKWLFHPALTKRYMPSDGRPVLPNQPIMGTLPPSNTLFVTPRVT
jgi:hypothetical protein